MYAYQCSKYATQWRQYNSFYRHVFFTLPGACELDCVDTLGSCELQSNQIC